MAIKIADTVKNAMLDAIETTWTAGYILRIYSGTAPADETTALPTSPAPVLLVTITPGDAPNASGGSKSMINGTPQATAVAAGTASFYRVYNAGGTTSFEQGSVGTSGADMTLDNTSIASGQTVRITSWNKTIPD